ncbi:Outer membrane porin F [Zhongshania aliphaticivorans]|uniref:Outer membrane porin F n=1 Tax=Zhongshania aliphaticivorans TaxID=1470434 RepID=A0A5S9N538_9GAMM|nr:OmpA family protein [Zhongshania aliphaticivorans]CAA0082812.1 Outer membrane porin F [Zhongshania aliphaticivorans]CAA0083915.1 Outer membrane porin F [Zhongshania aliphaticivorans]
MRKVLLSAAITAAMCPSLASAAEDGKWYLNPAIGYMVFDGDRDLDPTAVGIVGAEYKLDQDWGVEARAFYSDAEHYRGNSNLDQEVLGASLDVLRYFGGESKLTPYMAGGIGLVDANPATGAYNAQTQLNAGGGVRYALDDAWSVRTDARYIYGTDNETADGIVSVGISYAFGGSAAAPAPMPAPAPVTGDADADGVEDGVDQCSGTPAGVAVDAKGCALDKDGDGVPNFRDKCPNTPAGRQVDKFGCKFVLKHTESIKLEINFANNSDAIPAAYAAELKKVADFMNKFGSTATVVEGHADSNGAAAYNKQLSQRRADAVRNALIRDYGIAANRLSAVGYGEERPIADNKTSAGRAANRRVIAVVPVEVVE